MEKLFFETGMTEMMQRFLDLSAQRQSLVASNLANVDTPGYKTVDINFEKELQRSMESHGISVEVTNSRHLSASGQGEHQVLGVVKEVDGLTQRNDLNNVNIDREMTQMSANGLKFSAVTQLLVNEVRMLKMAITEK